MSETHALSLCIPTLSFTLNPAILSPKNIQASLKMPVLSPNALDSTCLFSTFQSRMQLGLITRPKRSPGCYASALNSQAFSATQVIFPKTKSDKNLLSRPISANSYIQPSCLPVTLRGEDWIPGVTTETS